MQRGPFLPATVEVRDTGGAKGLAVYAARRFEQGELVERCPVIFFEAPADLVLPEILRLRVFAWSQLTHQQMARKESVPHALALGYGSLYNHARPANLRYAALRSTATLEFTAARNIETGEELTVDYDQGVALNSPSESPWAHRHHVRLE